MKCPVCGKEVPEPAHVCPACDSVLDQTLEAPPGRIPASPTRRSGRARREGAPRAIHARFLVVPILARPIKLAAEKVYRIGRERGSEIYFPSGHVSRSHAELRFEGGAWNVTDLGSRNGTLVNGERVHQRELRDGDRITVGELAITYIEATKDESKKILAGDVDSGASETRRLGEASEELYGELASISVLEIVQLLHKNRKTGCLEILEAGVTSPHKLFFLKGALVHAEAGDLQGETAGVLALRVRDGRFAFRHAKATKITMITPVEKLLLQAAPGDDAPPE